jgi:membrane protease YdiL (CAAX protease family)
VSAAGTAPGIATPAPRWYEVLLALALVMVFGVLAIGAVALLQRAAPELVSFWSRSERAPILLLPLEALMLLAACWLALFRRAGEKPLVLGIVPLRSPWARRSILAGVLLFIAAVAVALLIERLLGRPLRTPTPADLGLAEASPMRFAFILLMGGYLVPLAEEVLFRGVIFRWLFEKLGFGLAALLSGAFFGALHAGNGTDHVWITAGYGVVFAWLYWRSGSLWAPVFAHRVTNSIAITLAWLTAGAGS